MKGMLVAFFSSYPISSVHNATNEKGLIMKNKNRKETQTVEGLLIPCAWDDDGVVLEMELQTTDEKTYRIDNSEFFLNLVGKCIHATGPITTSKKGEKRIFIKKIDMMETDDISMSPRRR